MTGDPRRQAFRNLVEDEETLVVPGAYDALSARMIESAGFSAAYIGSYATSATAHGLPDVGALTLTELAEHAARVSRAVSIPVLADAEAGFFDAANIWRTVEAFENAGVCGIHLEDHGGGKHTDAGRSLQPVGEVVARIQAAVDARSDPNFLVVGRTDAVWVSGNLDEAVGRMQAYAEAGADLVFPTGVTASQLVSVRKDIPGRVMVLGDLPRASLADLESAGADVVVYYALTLAAAVHGVGSALDALARTGDVRLLDAQLEDSSTLEARLDYGGYAARAARYSPEPTTPTRRKTNRCV